MDDCVRIIFAGDFIPPENADNLFSKELLTVLKDKDFSIVNLETSLTEGSNVIEKKEKHFKIDPKSNKHIKNGFFDAVALANNHICDFG